MNTDLVKEIIKKSMKINHIFINSDDNVHYKAIIISDDFKDLNLINRQRKVNKILNKLIIEGEIHAITLKTYTKDEWEKIKFKCFN
jgi:acid stress-induced BolA-like protein IbaG/YrbA